MSTVSPHYMSWSHALRTGRQWGSTLFFHGSSGMAHIFSDSLWAAWISGRNLEIPYRDYFLLKVKMAIPWLVVLVAGFHFATSSPTTIRDPTTDRVHTVQLYFSVPSDPLFVGGVFRGIIPPIQCFEVSVRLWVVMRSWPGRPCRISLLFMWKTMESLMSLPNFLSWRRARICPTLICLSQRLPRWSLPHDIR